VAASSSGDEVAAWASFGDQRRTRDFGECLMRKSRLAVLTVGVSLLVAGWLAPPSTAATNPTRVTINLTAVVDLVDNPNGVPVGSIAPRDVITGSYTYNSKTKDSNPLLEVGTYVHDRKPYGIQLNMGSFSVQTDPANIDFQIRIENNHNGSDAYTVSSSNNVGTEPGPGVQAISWFLTDPTQTALSNTALTATPPVLSSWQQTNVLEVDGRVDAPYTILAHVTQAVKVA